MKFVSLTAAVLLLAAATTAQAQHQPTTNVTPPPNSINHAANQKTTGGAKSGAESQAAAEGRGARIVGRSRYCTQGRDHVLHCRYRSMASCEKYGRHGGLSCVANPAMATGQAPMRR